MVGREGWEKEHQSPAPKAVTADLSQPTADLGGASPATHEMVTSGPTHPPSCPPPLSMLSLCDALILG